jgi:hypothetical protein
MPDFLKILSPLQVMLPISCFLLEVPVLLGSWCGKSSSIWIEICGLFAYFEMWLDLIGSLALLIAPLKFRSLFRALTSLGEPWLPLRVSTRAGIWLTPLAAVNRSLFLRSRALFDKINADLSASEVSFLALLFGKPLVAELFVYGKFFTWELDCL